MVRRTWNNPPLGLVGNLSSPPPPARAPATTSTPVSEIDPRLSFLTLTGVAEDFNTPTPTPPPPPTFTASSTCSFGSLVATLNALFVGDAGVCSLLEGNATFVGLNGLPG